MLDSDVGVFNIYFHEEAGKYVHRTPVKTKRALDNREIRVTLNKSKTKYKIHLVDLTASRQKLLASGDVKSIEQLIQVSNELESSFGKL